MPTELLRDNLKPSVFLRMSKVAGARRGTRLCSVCTGNLTSPMICVSCENLLSEEDFRDESRIPGEGTIARRAAVTWRTR